MLKIRFMQQRACSFGLILPLVLAFFSAQSQTAAFTEPPAWSKSAVWYQIFVERFHNGNPKNDPTPATIRIPGLMEPPAGWTVAPWTMDWHSLLPWEKAMNRPFHETVQFRRYGGDLEGVMKKLDYLQSLGVTAIYFNPLNHAPSLHKYDAAAFHHIDANFGPDPEGDRALMAKEDPGDPATWVWTAADEYFLKLVKEMHRRNMKVILDFSWNHTGTTFWAWQDILKNQEKSTYKNWYSIERFDDPSTSENEFTYQGWANVPSLPEFKKVNVQGERISGKPYEGDQLAQVKSHIYSVTTRWLRPMGDTTQGVDGFRLDVADQIGLKFWRDYRKMVRSVNPNAYLIGEIWWESWPEALMNPAPYTQGDMFDAVMFYQAYKPARYFFAKTDRSLDAPAFRDSLLAEFNRLRKQNLYAMMNVSSSHDAPRLLTDFANPFAYKYRANPHENPDYIVSKPKEDVYQRLRLYLLHQYTSVGAPHIWNGEEMGMWGADDPHPRKPLWWKEMKFTMEGGSPEYPSYSPVAFDAKQFTYYQQLIRMRKRYPALVDGDIRFIYAEGKVIAYERVLGKQRLEVWLNAGEEPVRIPRKATDLRVDVISGKSLPRNELILGPLSGVVLN